MKHPSGQCPKIRFYGDNEIKETTGFWATPFIPFAGVWVRQCENGTTNRTMTYHDHATTHNLCFERVQVFGTTHVYPAIRIDQPCRGLPKGQPHHPSTGILWVRTIPVMRSIFLQPGPFGMDEITRKSGFEQLQTL